MVGRGSRRDEGSFTVSNSNVFAALESLKKKKKSDKEKGASRGSKASSRGDASVNSEEVEEQKQVYWAPAPLTVKSWADVDDEDDDDYYATTAPPNAIWGASGSDKADELHKPDIIEESESEDELPDEDDEEEEEHGDQELNVQQQAEPLVKEPLELPPARKEAERQLSKKERKKKELAELEAILADFGVNPQEKAKDEQSESLKYTKEKQLNGDEENNHTVPKAGKKKKNKDKASKDVKELQSDPNTSTAPSEHEGGDQAAGDDNVGVKDRLKKVALVKKKKSNKEIDGAARAVALEAAARSAKLAAAKKKEKNHYNQQPTR